MVWTQVSNNVWEHNMRWLVKSLDASINGRRGLGPGADHDLDSMASSGMPGHQDDLGLHSAPGLHGDAMGVATPSRGAQWLSVSLHCHNIFVIRHGRAGPWPVRSAAAGAVPRGLGADRAKLGGTRGAPGGCVAELDGYLCAWLAVCIA